MNRNNNFITKNYGRLKFEYDLDIVLIDNDEELIELLLDKLRELGEVEDLKENVKWLQEELNDLKIAYQDLEEEFDTFKEEHT